MRKINWPKPFTKQLTRDQIRLALRVILDDEFRRRQRGYKRNTKGLVDRLAAEFGVKRKIISEISEIRRNPRGRDRFHDIDFTKERELAKLRHQRRLAQAGAE